MGPVEGWILWCSCLLLHEGVSTPCGTQSSVRLLVGQVAVHDACQPARAVVPQTVPYPAPGAQQHGA